MHFTFPGKRMPITPKFAGWLFSGRFGLGAVRPGMIINPATPIPLWLQPCWLVGYFGTQRRAHRLPAQDMSFERMADRVPATPNQANPLQPIAEADMLSNVGTGWSHSSLMRSWFGTEWNIRRSFRWCFLSVRHRIMSGHRLSYCFLLNRFESSFMHVTNNVDYHVMHNLTWTKLSAEYHLIGLSQKQFCLRYSHICNFASLLTANFAGK